MAVPEFCPGTGLPVLILISGTKYFRYWFRYHLKNRDVILWCVAVLKEHHFHHHFVIRLRFQNRELILQYVLMFEC